MRMGIRAKLFAGFGAVLLLLGIVGGLGFLKLKEADNAASVIANREMASVAAAYQAQVALTTMQRDLRQAVLVEGDEANRKWQASLAAAEKKFGEGLARHGKLTGEQSWHQIDCQCSGVRTLATTSDH